MERQPYYLPTPPPPDQKVSTLFFDYTYIRENVKCLFGYGLWVDGSSNYSIGGKKQACRSSNYSIESEFF